MPSAVLVRLPSDLGDRLTQRAERAGLTQASMARRLIADGLEDVILDIRPMKRRRKPKPAPTVDVVAVAGLREVLGEVGGALVQAAVRSREAGHLTTHLAIEEILPRVKELVDFAQAWKTTLLANQQKADE